MAESVIVERIHPHLLDEFTFGCEPVHVLFSTNGEYQIGKQYYLGPAFGGASEYFECTSISPYTDTVMVDFVNSTTGTMARVSIPFHAVTEIRGITKNESE